MRLRSKPVEVTPRAVSSLQASSWRRRTYEELEPRARRRPGLSATNLVIVVTVLLGVVSAILETEPTLHASYGWVFESVDTPLTLLFSLEYAARLWTAAETPGPGSALTKRFRFAVSFAAFLDLLFVVTACAPFFFGNLALLRMVRLARIARLARLGRFSRAAEHLHYALKSRSYELLLAFSLGLVMLVAGATALYWVEGTVQPDKFGSIPRAMWWAGVTLTTIGYGDVSPITPLGKFVAILVAITGIALIALPTGILASGLSEAVQRDANLDDDSDKSTMNSGR